MKLLTQSEAAFDYANPSAEEIRIIDIAHALGNLCRFTGHTRVLKLPPCSEESLGYRLFWPLR